MPEYLTPLPALLAQTLETAINKVLQMDMESPSRVNKLQGRLLQVDLEGLAITLFFTFRHGVVHVNLEADAKPDTVISGTPVALFTGLKVMVGAVRVFGFVPSPSVSGVPSVLYNISEPEFV